MSKPGGTIYAIGAVGTPYVKIGSTMGTVQQRLKALQTSHPLPLEVLATVPVEANLRRIERQIHAFLEAERRHGEWFETPVDLSTLETLIIRAIQFLTEQGREDAAPALSPWLICFGERVRRLRMARGVSQTELAEQVAIPLPNLNRIEHGRQSIYIERLADLALALETTTDYLIGLNDNPTPPKRPRSRQAAPVG